MAASLFWFERSAETPEAQSTELFKTTTSAAPDGDSWWALFVFHLGVKIASSLCVSLGFTFLVCASCVLRVRRALQQFETYHDGEVLKLHQFEVMQLANLMQADSEVEEVRSS